MNTWKFSHYLLTSYLQKFINWVVKSYSDAAEKRQLLDDC